MIEYWDAYDENRNQLGHKLIRGEPIPNGEYHNTGLLVPNLDYFYFIYESREQYGKN